MEKGQKEPARGLGSNKGDEAWTKAQEKRDKEKKFADSLRGLNKRFGLLNAERKEDTGSPNKMSTIKEASVSHELTAQNL